MDKSPRTEIEEMLEQHKKLAGERERELWELSKYVQLLQILEEAKQLTKELQTELDKIKPDFSSLEKS